MLHIFNNDLLGEFSQLHVILYTTINCIINVDCPKNNVQVNHNDSCRQQEMYFSI